MKCKPFSCFFGALIMSLLPPTANFFGDVAFAEETRNTDSQQSRILLDYNSKNLVVYGNYSPKSQGKKNGIDAEVAARRDAKQIASEGMASFCKGAVKDESWSSRVKLSKEWDPKEMVSQGSEIYADGVLIIKLTFPLMQLFSKYPATKIEPISNKDGKAFVFKIPAIPFSALKCGLVNLRLSQTRTMAVAPAYAVKPSENFTTISLHLSNDELVPATPADTAALSASQFGGGSEDGDGSSSSPVSLPIVPNSSL